MINLEVEGRIRSALSSGTREAKAFSKSGWDGPRGSIEKGRSKSEKERAGGPEKRAATRGCPQDEPNAKSGQEAQEGKGRGRGRSGGPASPAAGLPSLGESDQGVQGWESSILQRTILVMIS